MKMTPFWLDQYQISELLDTDRTSIVRHIQNIYKSSELDGKEELVQNLHKVNRIDILDDYDHQRLSLSDTPIQATFRISYDEAKHAVDELKKRFGESSLFGNQKTNPLRVPFQP